ncbi:MAG: copper chaperone PCu(A)C [Gammaproteobacteria bacterium]|nr:copper chaperone PCu(A)C [Gammaproteobacteria bacterium]
MTLINTNQEAVRLINIESDHFESVEMHEMAVVDGLMTMRQLSGLLVPANGSVKLTPGGKHLMLKGPKQEVNITQNIDVVLTFESGETQAISLKVAAR